MVDLGGIGIKWFQAKTKMENKGRLCGKGAPAYPQVPVSGFGNINIDCENWMGNLPQFLTNVPLIYLSIPGSHNSFSYSISPGSKVSPDSPSFVQSLGKWCKPVANRIIFNWSQGQKVDVLHQLNAGIRYFDVRLVMYCNDIVISHGLYGGNIHDFLMDINSFLSSHPKEIVILDFQHFYEFIPENHERMMSMLIQIFGKKICLRQRRMKENTLMKLWENGNQILIVYRHHLGGFNEYYWPSGTWITPWPNKVDVEELIHCLDDGLEKRREDMGYVSQAILTPSTKYVALHVFGTLKKLACEANQKVIPWLHSKNNGARGINVVICDFIEKFDFCKTVILLNYKASPDKLGYQENVKN